MATVNNRDERPTLAELTDVVSVELARDNDVDRAVVAALHCYPIAVAVIKALRASTGMSLSDAKVTVDRNLSRYVQESNERRRAAADAMRQLDREPPSTRS